MAATYGTGRRGREADLARLKPASRGPDGVTGAGARPCARFRLAACLLALVLALAFPPHRALAQGAGPGEPAKDVRVASTLTITEENDLFAGTDSNYTNGTRLNWVSGDISLYAKDHWLPRFLVQSLKVLPFLDRPDMQYNVGLSVAQTIYTPRDIHTSFYLPHDRPYAGWAFAALALHAKTPFRLDTFEVSPGIVGPASLAGDAQNTVHDILGIRRANGWRHQINNEPTLQLAWQRTLRTFRQDFGHNVAFDLLPHFGATAGNALDYANAGFEMRFGYKLPWDFGTSVIRPGSGVSAPAAQGDPRLKETGLPYGVHVFVGADGRAIARNIFLDGNTWQDSHSIPKKPFVADLSAGAGILLGPVKITYTHVLRTQEFYRQKSPQYFGSLGFSVTF